MIRELPRDAFNDSSLLFQVGLLTLGIHDNDITNLSVSYDNKPFNIVQDTADGSTIVENITFYFNNEIITVKRPLNTLDKWSLVAVINNVSYELFNQNGEYIFKGEK